ncbi:ThuA domain-containing protein [Isoptericola sp. 178]|uniref:ThuA domain-containing protein n=1 Tax=Isoptericola sp. 178 TaxID=3064651 RepID=UPI002713A738|nr:ThuA domain-containing protein [Isoptericola sp. 178]MDO8144818.1 ThuA domain-containing protein [Isoptericola sp. 178]
MTTSTRPRRIVSALATSAVAVGLCSAATAPAAAAEPGLEEILVVGKTLGFRHSHIDETTHALIDLGAEHGYEVDVWDPPNDSGGWWGPGSAGQPDLTMDSTPFTTAADLARYDSIVFVSPVDNTNNLDPAQPRLLDETEIAALQGYVHAGGGVVGLHAATDTMHTSSWFTRLIGGGARFAGHPRQQTATMRVENPAHPSMTDVPATWERWDEWYNYTLNPRGEVQVLMTLDEDTYDGGTMGDDHPIAWCQNFEGGRSWHQGAGHVDEAWSDPTFLTSVLRGIRWTAGTVSGGGDCVTFGEVDALVADLPAATARDRVAVDQLERRLATARAQAEAGEHGAAVRTLRPATALADALVADGATAGHLSGKVADLVTWQQALATTS